MKLLTITIPSYNSEKFIKKNMATFLDERLYEKVEILIINDGSTDKTAEIAKKLEKENGGYIRLINKENGGHGSGINRGIREARGKYFKIVDADDWVDTENLVGLMNDLEKNDADVFLNPFFTFDQQTKKKKLVNIKGLQGSQIGEPLEIILRKGIRLLLPAVTYRTSVLRNNKVMFTENCYYEDWEYTLYPVPYLETFSFSPNPVYCYLLGQQSQSVSNDSVLKNRDMHFRIMREMISHYELNKEEYNALLDQYIKGSISQFIRTTYNIYLRNYKVENIFGAMREMDGELKELSDEFYDLVGKKNLYIRWMRSGNKSVFTLLGKMMNAYKKIKQYG